MRRVARRRRLVSVAAIALALHLLISPFNASAELGVDPIGTESTTSMTGSDPGATSTTSAGNPASSSTLWTTTTRHDEPSTTVISSSTTLPSSTSVFIPFPSTSVVIPSTTTITTIARTTTSVTSGPLPFPPTSQGPTSPGQHEPAGDDTRQAPGTGDEVMPAGIPTAPQPTTVPAFPSELEAVIGAGTTTTPPLTPPRTDALLVSQPVGSEGRDTQATGLGAGVQRATPFPFNAPVPVLVSPSSTGSTTSSTASAVQRPSDSRMVPTSGRPNGASGLAAAGAPGASAGSDLPALKLGLGIAVLLGAAALVRRARG